MTPRFPGFEYESHGAEFDAQRVYRYSLHRMWGDGSQSDWRTVLWIMLNPSTADENVLDPTLRKCQEFTRLWGFDGFEVVNLFALRSTDPSGLYEVADPVGPENDAFIYRAAQRNELIVCGWGQEQLARNRAHAVLEMLKPFTLRCLRVNKDGSPQHPLYVAYANPLIEFKETT